MRPITFLLVGVAVMTTTVAAAATIAPADRIAIEQIFARQADAWNRHDAHAFVADMTPDVDWINVVGMHWQGRDLVQRAHETLHHLPLFANSRITMDVPELQPLSSDVVLAVDRSRMDGAGPTPGGGTYPSSGAIGTFLLVRTASGWRIAHGHNTTIDAQAAANDPARKAESIRPARQD